ncbi:ABC transporter ATP-binding protein [Castellaniella sp. GW247-6E4]|uniref:ABC transporter ATP-binding protein n=1 Tax=Castellaniella sp. GW247-6E4 TaxID=3140380 RepID=UPI00331597D5
MKTPLLQVENLRVEFPTRHGTLVAVRDVSFSVEAGRILGIVGESGAGKSLTGSAIIRLLEPPGRIADGQVLLDGQRIDNLPLATMRTVRGRQIGAIFQDPLTSLDPLQTIGSQLVETIDVHLDINRSASRARALELLGDVGIPAPADRFDQYPHQFSGGMRQRVVTALSLAARPRLIVADEPTTALDVSTQAQVMALLKRLCADHGVAVILITHDIGVIAEIADEIAVMYAGQLVEIGPVRQVIDQPQHPYTSGLMASVPRLEQRQARLNQIGGGMPRLDSMPTGCAFHPRCALATEQCRVESPPLELHFGRQVACWHAGEHHASQPESVTEGTPHPDAEARTEAPLVSVKALSRHFGISRSPLTRIVMGQKPQTLKAVDEVSLNIWRGETLAMVGESGCGKSTFARLMAGLYTPTSGNISFSGAPHSQPRIQMIFQDPYASLNPRWRVEDIIAEPMRMATPVPSAAQRRERVADLLNQVSLSPRDGGKYPHEFSGGQRQRISIARVLAADAEFIICDEPTSALDVSVQAQILNLMQDLQTTFNLTYLFISHNLAVVRHVADRVAVMYLGRIVEISDASEFFTSPAHPYSRLLLQSVPSLSRRDDERTAINGEVPNPMSPPSGCAFHPRCPYANDRCRVEAPRDVPRPSGRVACHAWEENRLPYM